jgi:MerR family transcriptional regulator, light-induced transcriptional regulator
MNNVKNIFSIRDLENLSGIKAHTIRIWEKRYNVLAPMRSETNIRQYDLASLQKLLNITLLHDHGYKISKISKYPEEQIPQLVTEIVTRKSAKHHAVNAFKMAMMKFDQKLFTTTYERLLAEKPLREIFYEVIIPLMEEIGLLWQTDTITPAHEHFITNMIKQKVLTTIEKLQAKEPIRQERTFVLFLPLEEMHELGLLYLHYETIQHGYKSIYLGQSMPSESMKDIKRFFDNVTYISYFTVSPVKEAAAEYVDQLVELLFDDTAELWLLGRNCSELHGKTLPGRVRTFMSIDELVNEL